MSESDEESKSTAINIDYSSRSWIYSLNKAQLLDIVRKCAKSDKDVIVDESNSVDELRKFLSEHIKRRNKQSTGSSESRSIDENIGNSRAETKNQNSVQSENKAPMKRIPLSCFEMTSKNNFEFNLGEDDWELYT